ncbi:MAG TPA: hypothetical protein VMD58_06995 [Acidobacteriaceae bacterium]|nr:hypothetical protein [Acidobacteriaceae bacterium]
MEPIDLSTLISLICGYKHLWLKYQELRYMKNHPDDDPETVREAVFDEVDDLFSPALDALSEGRFDQETLREIVNRIERAKELPFAE